MSLPLPHQSVFHGLQLYSWQGWWCDDAIEVNQVGGKRALNALTRETLSIHPTCKFDLKEDNFTLLRRFKRDLILWKSLSLSSHFTSIYASSLWSVASPTKNSSVPFDDGKIRVICKWMYSTTHRVETSRHIIVEFSRKDRTLCDDSVILLSHVHSLRTLTTTEAVTKLSLMTIMQQFLLQQLWSCHMSKFHCTHCTINASLARAACSGQTRFPT